VITNSNLVGCTTGQVGGFLALENAADVAPALTNCDCEAAAIELLTVQHGRQRGRRPAVFRHLGRWPARGRRAD
jgi:hypothetical protein